MDKLKEKIKKIKSNGSGISLTVFIAVCALFFWQLRDIKSDVRAFTAAIRNDMREFRQDMREFRQEIKDFHGRLCTLEEKYYQMDRKK